jgi:hypothetical protein
MDENKTIIIFDNKFKLFIKDLNAYLMLIDKRINNYYLCDIDIVDDRLEETDFEFNINKGIDINSIPDLQERHIKIREYTNKNIDKLNLLSKRNLDTTDHYAISVCILLENIDDYNSFDEILFQELFTKHHMKYDDVHKTICGCGNTTCLSMNMFRIETKKSINKIPTLIGSSCVKKYKIISEKEKQEVKNICYNNKKLKDNKAKFEANKINYLRLAFNIWKKKHPPKIYYQKCKYPPKIYYQKCKYDTPLYHLYKKYNCKWDKDKVLWYSKKNIPELEDLQI